MTAGKAEGKESKSLPENPFLQKVVFRTFPQKLLNGFNLTGATVIASALEPPPAI